MPFTPVLRVGELAEGEGRSVEMADRVLAIFLRGGEYFAIDDFCPHQGASLGAGHLDEEGAVVCPWHAWRFRLADGKWADNPRLGVCTYPTRVVDDRVEVDTPHPASP